MIILTEERKKEVCFYDINKNTLSIWVREWITKPVVDDLIQRLTIELMGWSMF